MIKGFLLLDFSVPTTSFHHNHSIIVLLRMTAIPETTTAVVLHGIDDIRLVCSLHSPFVFLYPSELLSF